MSTKFVCPKYLISLACAFPARSPCPFGSQPHFAISVFQKVIKKLRFFDATFVGRSESESCEMRPIAGTSVSSLLKPRWEVSQAVSHCLIFVILFLFVLSFGSDRAVFLVLDRHSAHLLDLKMFLMSSTVAMWKTNWRQMWASTTGPLI